MATLVRRFYARNFMASAFGQAAHRPFVKVDRGLLLALVAGHGAGLEEQLGALEAAEQTCRDGRQVVAERATTPKAQQVVGEVRELFDRWKSGRAGLIAQAK